MKRLQKKMLASAAHFNLLPYDVTMRALAGQPPTTSLFCILRYLNTQYGYVAPHYILSTKGMHTALVTTISGLLLRAKEEK